VYASKSSSLLRRAPADSKAITEEVKAAGGGTDRAVFQGIPSSNHELYRSEEGGWIVSKADHLNRYAEGWVTGDAGVIASALDDGYQLDDPNAGMISKAAFPEYHAAFKGQVESIRGVSGDAWLDLSELVTQEEGDVLTAWAWWTVPGTPLEGSGLIKVGDGGVLSERLTFYTKVPEA